MPQWVTIEGRRASSRGAAREQHEAQQERHDAKRQERKADRDDNGTTLRLGH
jgi:hypothetical protein